MTEPARTFRVVLYSPDRARTYDGRTRDAQGVGGGITARLSLLEALAGLGHDVTAYVHCEAPLVHRGVSYEPLDSAAAIACDVFIAISTGGAMTLAPLRGIRVDAGLRILWVQGVPQPTDIDAVGADFVVTASNFLRQVCARQWRVPAGRLFVCYNGLHQEYFRDAERDAAARDPFGIAFVGPPEKGLGACVRVVQALRQIEPRFHLDVFGGAQLWGRPADPPIDEPGIAFKGMLGQRALAPALFGYEFLLALQDIAEGFGMAVQEAKRAGAIPIVSNVGAFGELIRHGADGYLIGGAADSQGAQSAATDLIRQLADDPLRRGRIRRRAMSVPWDWNLAARAWTDHWHLFFDRKLDTQATTIDLADGRHRLSDGAYFPTVYPISPLPDRLGVSEPRKILLAGYFAHGNLGDEASLSVSLDEWQRLRPDLTPVVASADPAATAAAHDVESVGERDLAALAAAARQSEAIALIGGGQFHDAHGANESTVMTPHHSGIPECATFAALAQAVGTRLLIVGTGVGPLTTEAGHRLTRFVFDRADSATVRDRESARLVESLQVARTPGVSADLAFLLPTAPAAAADRVLRAVGIAGTGRIVCVVVRRLDPDDDAVRRETAIASALDRLIRTMGVTVLFIPFQSSADRLGDDGAAIERVRQRMERGDAIRVLPGGLAPSIVQAVFARSQVVLAMRLHALILAANAGTPIVALSYADKIPNTLRRLDLPDEGVDLATLTSEVLGRRLIAALDSRLPSADGQRPALPGIRESARRAFVIAAEALHHPPLEYHASAESLPFHERAARVVGGSPGATDAPNAARSAAASAERGVAYGVARSLIPRAWRRPLRTTWQARFLSPAGLTFDRYKRARMRMCGRDLGEVRAPDIAGLVSIVLPVHDGGPMLREAIDSILSQRYGNFELIVVDDGSTDGSGAVAADSAGRDPRVRVIHQDCRRLPAALNAGFHGARGEFLTWASADNRLRPDALTRLVDCLRRHPSWDVTFANLDLIDQHGLPLRQSPYFHSYQRPAGSEHVSLPAVTEELNTRDNNFIGAGFMYRRRVATLLGDYSPARFGTEDYDYWMRANALLTLRKADFEEPVVEYRFHAGSLTARAETLGLPAARARLQVFDQFRRDAALWPLVWIVDPSLTIGDALLRRISEAGHTRYDGTYPADQLPSPWVGSVAVSEDPNFLRAHRAATLRVLLETEKRPRESFSGKRQLEESISEALPETDSWSRSSAIWDLRVRIDADPPPDWRPDDRRSIVAPDVNALFHAVDVRARSAIFSNVEALIDTPPRAPLTASVVICAGRPIATLETVVSAVLTQSFPSDQFELIVVDNNPHDAALAGTLRRLPPGVRVIPCPIAGHSAARNAGLAAARGKYVCYLDDDAVPGPEWLANLCRAFDAHPDAGVIGGPILLRLTPPAPAAFTPGWAHFWSHLDPPFREYRDVADRSDFPWGANWAARRDALFQIGGFRLAFGRRGDDHRGGEEVVAALVAQRLGHGVGIAPDAPVEHRIDPARVTTAHVRHTQMARHLVAQAAARDVGGAIRGGVGSAVARLLLRHVDPRVRAWPHVVQDIAYRKIAQWAALRADVADFRRRFRRAARED